MSTMLGTVLEKYAKPGLQWAAEADTFADAKERAASRHDYAIASASYEAAREKLYAVLKGLATGEWTEPTLGLLPVETFLQERDPALYGVFASILDPTETVGGRIAFRCCTEAYLFVYPDRALVKALLAGWPYVSRVRTEDGGAAKFAFGDQLRAEILTELRKDDFWIPQGTSSLDSFVTAASEPAPAAPEDEARSVLHHYGWSWEAVRDQLKSSDERQLLRMIGFRRNLTSALMNRAIDFVMPKAQERYRDGFRWVVYDAPGSDRLTSDHDVLMSGTLTGEVVKRFNMLFRQWTMGTVDDTGAPRTTAVPQKPACELESAFVFDTNVYASDYQWSAGRRFLAHDAPDPNLWPTAKDRLKQAETLQDRYALLKIRRYVDDKTWAAFTTALHAALSGSDQVAGGAQIAEVNKLWTALKKTMEDKLAEINRRPLFAQYPKNAKARAENELYQAQVDVVEAIRWNDGTPMDDAARVNLAGALGLAGFYAQEAYHTAGAVRDVVANMQQRKGLVLSDMELLCSLNEQAGDLFKELSHLDPLKDPSTDLDFAIKVSKYMVRLGNAALGLNYRLVDAMLTAQWNLVQSAGSLSSSSSSSSTAPPTPSLPALADPSSSERAMLEMLLELQALCGAWRRSTARLLEIKDRPDDFKDEKGLAERAKRLNDTPWRQGVVDLRELLVNLTVALNVQYRGKNSAGSIATFLGVALSAVMRAVDTATAKKNEPAEPTSF